MPSPRRVSQILKRKTSSSVLGKRKASPKPRKRK